MQNAFKLHSLRTPMGASLVFVFYASSFVLLFFMNVSINECNGLNDNSKKNVSLEKLNKHNSRRDEKTMRHTLYAGIIVFDKDSTRKNKKTA